jgi:hypothetical protein
LRVACVDGNGFVLPEECYRDRTPGCFHSDEGIVYYQFREEDGRLHLEICGPAVPERNGRRFIVGSDDTVFELPALLDRRRRGLERGTISPSCLRRRYSHRRGFPRRGPVRDEAVDRNGLRVTAGGAPVARRLTLPGP